MWLIIGLVAGAALLALVLWLRGKDIKVSWYEWLIGAVGLILLLFSLQNYFGFRAELDYAIAPTILLLTGLPALILIAVAGLLAWKRFRTQT